MGKLKSTRTLGEYEAMATTRNLRVSPYKLNLVAASIRGKQVEIALNDLHFLRKRIALDVRKTLQSAIANAENNHGLDIDSLVVSEAFVGKGIVMRRFRPRAKGRPSKVKKAFSSIRVIVREQQEVN